MKQEYGSDCVEKYPYITDDGTVPVHFNGNTFRSVRIVRRLTLWTETETDFEVVDRHCHLRALCITRNNYYLNFFLPRDPITGRGDERGGGRGVPIDRVVDPTESRRATNISPRSSRLTDYVSARDKIGTGKSERCPVRYAIIICRCCCYLARTRPLANEILSATAARRWTDYRSSEFDNGFFSRRRVEPTPGRGVAAAKGRGGAVRK